MSAMHAEDPASVSLSRRETAMAAGMERPMCERRTAAVASKPEPEPYLAMEEHRRRQETRP